jgi:hypothetical protein
MDKVYVIFFKESDRVEGVIQNISDFPKWLEQHNQDRREADESDEYFVEEKEEEFILISTTFYK